MSETLSTKEVSVGGGGMSKTILPGNVAAMLRKVELTQTPYAIKKNGYFVTLSLETPPIEGFEGFFLNPEDESLGRYLGQVGRVKTHNWPYSDGTTKGGVKVSRDMDIMKALKQLCIALGEDAVKWFDDQDGLHKDIHSLVAAFNASDVYKDRLLNWCIAAREYPKDNGHKGQDLYLPKFANNKVPYESAAVAKESSKLIKFDKAVHIEVTEGESVTNFAGDAPPGEAGAGGSSAEAAAAEDFQV